MSNHIECRCSRCVWRERLMSYAILIPIAVWVIGTAASCLRGAS